MVDAHRHVYCLPPCGGDVSPGQMVRLGANTGPVYRIIAVDSGKCWVRDEERAEDFLAPVWRCYPAFLD